MLSLKNVNFKKIKNMISLKDLPRIIILLIILIALYFVYSKYLKEGFEVDASNLETEIGSGTKLVMFYADWCGHCKKLKPVWDEAAADVNKKEKRMIKVNCGEGTEHDDKIMKNPNLKSLNLKNLKSLNLKTLSKHLPTILVVLIIVVAIYFVYKKFLKEGFEVESNKFDPGSGTKLVMFYADWCGHCKKLKPVWDEAAEEVNKDETKMIRVNCGNDTPSDKKLMKQYNIAGYPTIIKFVNGKPSEYQGDRDADSFKDMFR